MDNDYILSSDFKNSNRSEAVPELDRSNGYKRNGRRRANETNRGQVTMDPRSRVARRFLRMSEAHDRIRMKILAANIVRGR